MANTVAIRSLETLLQHHEQIAAAIRTTLTLLAADDTTKKQARGGGILAEALVLDQQRQARMGGAANGHARGFGPAEIHRVAATRGATKHPKGKTRATRERTANFLADFSRTEPTIPPKGMDPRSLSVLVRNGFLKRRRDGFTRTAKPFYVNTYEAKQAAKGVPRAKATTPRAAQRPAKLPWKDNPARRAERRARTAQLLSQFNTEVPHTPPVGTKVGLGMLVQQGYLMRSGDGWIRTGKEFQV